MVFDEIKRAKIMECYEVSEDVHMTAKRHKCSVSTVYRIAGEKGAKARSRRKTGTHKKNTSRRKEVTTRVGRLRNLVAETIEVHGRTFPKFGSAPKLAKALKTQFGDCVTDRTVRRTLKEAKLCYRIRKSVPTRRRVDLNARRAFRGRITNMNKDLIVFSDETWLSTQENTGRGQWVDKGQAPLPRETRDRRNLPRIMVWAAIGVNYKSDLIIFPTTSKGEDEYDPRKAYRLTADRYIRTCLSKVVPDLKAKGLVFQQDGARAHTAKQTSAYLERKGIQRIHDWPPYSPDLNMIEKLWATLHRRVGEKCPTTLEELKRAAREAWDEIPQSVINNHCRHFATALAENI